MSAVFDFNASLNDFTPFSPMSFAVEVMRKEWIIDSCRSCVSFCLHLSDQAL